MGRRIFVCTVHTTVCFILFVVGGLYYAHASNGNAQASKALVNRFLIRYTFLLWTNVVKLVICCFWNFGYSIIAKAYYLFSAELPTAILRGEAKCCQRRAVLINFSENGPDDLLRELNSWSRRHVRFSLNFPNSTTYLCRFAVPPMLVHMNLRTAFVFGAFSVPISVCLWCFLPETKG